MSTKASRRLLHKHDEHPQPQATDVQAQPLQACQEQSLPPLVLHHDGYTLEFKFSQHVPINGVKSKVEALMKMSNCTFIYPVCGGSVFVDMNPIGVGTVADHGVITLRYKHRH